MAPHRELPDEGPHMDLHPIVSRSKDIPAGNAAGTDRRSEVIDIRRGVIQHSILDDMMQKLQPALGQEKKMPTLLLYDEVGLKLFEDITYLPDYYLTNAEIETLELHATEIAARIVPGSMVVELGSGNLRKVNIILRALEKIGKDVDYYALDLSLPELHRTLAHVPRDFEKVKCFGLHGTYDDGLAWLQQPENVSRPKYILSLGSSIGNFTRSEAAGFLSGFAGILSPEDMMIVGVDACKDEDRVFRAYNDSAGVTHNFIRNGLAHANAIIGHETFRPEQWDVVGEYDAKASRHQAFYVARSDLATGTMSFKAGERIRVEESYKYSREESRDLWVRAGLTELTAYSNKTSDYHLHVLERAKRGFDQGPSEYAAHPVPSLAEWTALWSLWDTVTKGMIPENELLSQPIKLRNACIFYLGHIPTFFDLHITRATDGKPTEPATYPDIFERGIDPDVENPEQCHAHSLIPESWPPVDEILDFQERVRGRVRKLYQDSAVEKLPKLGRALWLGFEHECMHLETLLYMLVQNDKSLPPPGTGVPDFEGMSRQAAASEVPNEWVTIPSCHLTIGMDDSENGDGVHGYHGWDNEQPSRSVTVQSFQAKCRPISIGEYAAYLEKTGQLGVPASWATNSSKDGQTSSDEGSSKAVAQATANLTGQSKASPGKAYLEGKSVRTVFGQVPLAQALHWPVMCSYHELLGCALWMGGRIPTLEETRSIYHYADHLKTRDADKVLAQRIDAVNGHLSNHGVQETPPSHPWQHGSSSVTDGPDPRRFFADLQGCNVGFQHWHPTPVTHQGNKVSGQGDMGGAWEWTSSILERHDGFKEMELYPGYTADFFDGKHNVCLGGSWATHPRIAGRKTFINWYQRNYPYVWAGARMVRDIQHD
ncbi:MAG: hypothetical protein M1817_005316 [Caeruleum heppii]|nr:MAG: hypothetical protein M1817_005316 [Caeruleum heppii]